MSIGVSGIEKLCCFFMSSNTLDDELFNTIECSLAIAYTIVSVCVRSVVGCINDESISGEKFFIIMFWTFIHHPKRHGPTVGDSNSKLASYGLLDYWALRIVFN